MSTPVVIEARGLRKRYGRAVAVDGVDLAVGKGEVFGLLGPNGSGKTTTILMLLGLTEPSGGEVRVLGYDPLRQPLAVKRRVGYLPDSVGFYDHLSATENLAYTARLAGIPAAEAGKRIAGALERVGLAASADRRTATFSHGMRQRLGLAEVLVKQPSVAILDEPTNGLDPQATHELLDLIGELRRDGMTILLSSHLLGLVETICDRVALFSSGKVGLSGRVDDLAREVLGGSYVVEVEAENIDLPSALSGVAGIAAVASLGGQNFRVDADRDLRPDIARLVVGRGGALRNMAIRRAGLDEVYVRYFQRAEAGATEVAHAA
jgi:ABC-2 type transport system ATP-binding protein